MPLVRQAARVFKKISCLPYMFQGDGFEGRYTWSNEGELVREIRRIE